MCMESKGYRVVRTIRVLELVQEGYLSQVHVCKYIQPGKQAGGIRSAYSQRARTLLV